MRAILVAILAMVCLAAAQKNRGNRPKPSMRDRQERQKDLFWFKVGDEDTEACKEVDEATVEIVPGAPGDSCKEDEERFCFCGKKGAAETSNWKFICGTCIKNKPFSFKIERPDDPRSLKEKVKDRLKKRFGGNKPEQDG